MSINSVTISGNLCADPELRTTSSGAAILSLRVAVNDRRKNSQTGEWEDVPNYVGVSMFGARADALSKYLAKGSKVAIHGRLRWSQWDDKETGKKRERLDVVADDLELMSKERGEQAQTKQQAQRPQPYSQPSYADPYAGEDIPF